MIGIGTAEERVQGLRENGIQSSSWPSEAAPRVQAFVRGFTGNREAPEAVIVEVLRPDETTAQIELPYEALTPLWAFLQPWLHLPVLNEEIQR